MDELENLKGKNVFITVAFSSSLVDAGSIPSRFTGVLEKIDGDFLVLSNAKIEKRTFTSSYYENYSNSMIINKQYLIMIAEA